MTGPSYSHLAVFLLSSLTLGYAATLCTPAKMTQDNLKKLSTANNDLALNVLRQLETKSSGNIFFSPMSLSTAFGMLYYGTKGETAKELHNILGYETANIPEELVHQTFQHFLTKALPSQQDPSAYVLNSANAILLDKNLDLVPTYKYDIQNLYQAAVEDVDFSRDGPQVVEKVNSWVNEKTNGKIDKLLDKLDPNSVLVLLNAVYFKGAWKIPFESTETRQETFYNNGLEAGAKKISMMRMTEHFPYTAVDDVKVVELPYKGENISMIVILPHNRNGLESLVGNLTLEKLAVIRQQLYRRHVHIVIPKFKIQYSREMSGDFQALGAKHVFQPGADFSGLAKDKDIYVNQILHKAVVEVNEEGSEAAAITGIGARRSRPSFFVADHPFLFAIVDKRSDMILFLGRVTNL